MIAERWRMRGFYIAMISIEEVHLNKGMAAFIELFRKQQTIRGTNYLLHLYHPEGKKIDRIRYNLEPAINNREVYFIQNTYSTDFEKLYRQLQQFPNSDKLDVIDVFAQGVDVWRHRGDLQNPNQKAKKTREAIYNPLTGRFE
jgi:hypothetical protein